MIDRKFCQTTVFYFPPWPCPACKQGSIQGEANSIHCWPDKGIVFGIDEGFIERWDDYGVFSATLKCSNYQCGQGVAVIGDYSTHQVGTQPWETERKYEVRDVHPAILLIDVHDATPKPITTALNSSFALYWRDPQACAAKIRTALEEIADHLGQPKKVNGKFVPLRTRLNNLKSRHAELCEAADVLRKVGNDGAHGDQIDRDNLLTSYELFEIELRRLFNDDESRRKALITMLLSQQP